MWNSTKSTKLSALCAGPALFRAGKHPAGCKPRHQHDDQGQYFTSACATPAVIFPNAFESCVKEASAQGPQTAAKPGLVYAGRQATHGYALTGMPHHKDHIPAPHPVRAGRFQLGYYHQTQKRYEKKIRTNAAETIKEENYNV
jgi:CRISPR-associated protein Csd1